MRLKELCPWQLRFTVNRRDHMGIITIPCVVPKYSAKPRYEYRARRRTELSTELLGTVLRRKTCT